MADKTPSTIIVRILIVLMALAIFAVVADLVPTLHYVEIKNDYSSPPQDSRRVLFVGNSHTFVHHVPHIVQRLVTTSSPPLAFTALASPGKNLAWHVQRGDVPKTAADETFDIIVIQPQSTELIVDPAATKRAAIEIGAQSPDATPILFQTWPRHPERDDFGRQFGSSEKWNETTLRSARDVGFQIAPVGSVWSCTYNKTRLDLWSPDGNHSSIAGAYVTALVLHRSIYGPDEAWSDYAPAGLPANIAERLRTAADQCLTML